jgi:DNA-binding SARP family transcriptional activator
MIVTRLGGQPEGDNALEFRLLGNLEVIIDGAPVDVGGAQPRTVLAMLLVAEGRVVPAESIISALWGDSPPDSAAGTLQSYVSRLRRALVPGGARGEAAKVLAWDPPGYKLVVESDTLDTRRFEQLADRGRERLAAGHAAAARAALDEALRLWRGPALLEFSHLDFAWGFAARLEERKLVATEDRVEADLRLGQHAAVIGELGELVAAHPLREQFRHHLALALYRSGRQAEALRVLADARSTLRDQLGIDPGRPLVELESAILAQDPALTSDVPAPSGTAGTAGTVAPREVVSSVERAETARAVAPAPPPLVGRAVELRQAIAALDEAQAGTRVVLVEGEPGIGKTRLVEELAAEAAGRGVAVHWGRAFEGGATPAFWPWLPVLRTFARRPGVGPAAPALWSLIEGADAAEGAGPPDTGGGRYRLFDAAAGLVASVAASQPLMVVLDDLQWADLPSLELLRFAAAQLGDAPVLVVGTVRELEVGRNDAVVETLAALSRAHTTRRLSLRGLSHLDTAQLVESAAGRAVEPEVVAAIQERAEGNPFFATELARLVVAERDRDAALGAVSAGGDVPSGVRDVVRRRIALLPPPSVQLLQVAAAMGRDVELDLLAAATDRDIDAVLDDVEPAVVHRLLGPVPDRPATFRFSHALVREVVADDVSALRRARIHLRVADALEATGRELDDVAEILAEHLWAAVPIGVGRRAAVALERAAEVAVRRYAFESAEGILERAVQLRRTTGAAADTDTGSDTETKSDTEAELLTISRLLSIQRSLHGYASVIDSPHLRRGEELAARSGRVDVLARLLWTEWAGYDSRCEFDRSGAIAERLHALAEDADDPLVRVTGLASLGISRWHAGQVGEASALLDAAAAEGEKAGPPTMSLGLDLEVLLLPLPFSRYLHVLVGDAGGAARGEADLEALADAAPDRYAVPVIETLAAAAALMVGEPAWAERAARRGIAADPESRFTFWGRQLQGWLAAALIEQGRHDTGLALIDEAIDQYLAAGGRIGTVLLRAARTVGLAEAGRIDEAATALDATRRELERFGERFAEPVVLEAEARLRVARGDEPAESRALLARAAHLAATQGAHAVADRVAATAARLGLPLAPGA